MKKLLLFLLLGSSLLLLVQEEMDNDFVFLKEESNFPIVEIPPSSQKWLGNLLLLPKEPYNREKAADIVGTLSHLPESMLEKLWENRIYIRLFSGNLTDLKENVHLKGQRPRGYKEKFWDQVPGAGGGHIVYVKIGASDKGMGHGSENLELHELAHSIDKIVYSEIRKDPQFLAIWEKETEELFQNRQYFSRFPEEFFAESFALFYANKNTKNYLKEYGPSIYSYIEDLK